MDNQLQTIPFYDVADIDRFFLNLYQEASVSTSLKVADRIDFFSQRFLGRPYLLGALGEGPSGRYDQSPLYRYDVFDCISYVNTILALALSRDFSRFQKMMIELSYCNQQIDYLKRHHFMSVDWNVHNQKGGIIGDVTGQVKGLREQSIVLFNECEIHRPNWFRHRSFEDIKLLQPINRTQAQSLLLELHQHADKTNIAKGCVEYVPIASLFDQNGGVIQEIFDQIPDCALIEIVRPSWDLRNSIGTFLQISHIGFTVRRNGQLFFRHASSILKHVLDIPLHEYLYERLTSPSIKGINIQKIQIQDIQ